MGRSQTGLGAVTETTLTLLRNIKLNGINLVNFVCFHNFEFQVFSHIHIPGFQPISQMRRICFFVEIPPLALGKKKRKTEEVGEKWAFVLVGTFIVVLRLGGGESGETKGREGKDWFILKTPHDHPISCGVLFGGEGVTEGKEERGGEYSFSFPSSSSALSSSSPSSLSSPFLHPTFQLWTGDEQGLICAFLLQNNQIWLSDTLSTTSSISSESNSISCMSAVGKEVWVGSSQGEVTRWRGKDRKFLGNVERENEKEGKEQKRVHDTVIAGLLVKDEKVFSLSWDEKVKRWRKQK